MMPENASPIGSRSGILRRDIPIGSPFSGYLRRRVRHHRDAHRDDDRSIVVH